MKATGSYLLVAAVGVLFMGTAAAHGATRASSAQMNDR